MSLAGMVSRAHAEMANHVFHLDNHGISFSFAFSNGQAYLAVGQEHGDIALFTQAGLRKGEGSFHKFQIHKTWVKTLAFSSSGQEPQLLASGSTDNTVRLWDIYTKQCVAVLEGHTNSVSSVVFSPDGRLLASASYDSTVRLWDIQTKECAAILPGHTFWVFGVSFSPDGRQLASSSWDRTVRLWSVPQGVPGPVLQHAHPVWCVAFSPVAGSNLLASGSWDCIVRLWNVSGIKQQLLHELCGHSNRIRSVAFSPDGSQLVSGAWDNNARLWSVASGKLLKTLCPGYNVAFHPDGKQVASLSFDKTVRIWPVCEWSDRAHHLFGEELKRLVFCLMCIKEKLSCNANSILPNLSMALWLNIFAFLCND
jgi:WD40 repeat protein